MKPEPKQIQNDHKHKFEMENQYVNARLCLSFCLYVYFFLCWVCTAHIDLGKCLPFMPDKMSLAVNGLNCIMDGISEQETMQLFKQICVDHKLFGYLLSHIFELENLPQSEFYYFSCDQLIDIARGDYHFVVYWFDKIPKPLFNWMELKLHTYLQGKSI